MSDVRLFVSYDVDHDVDLCDRLIEESIRGGSGFALAARSAKGEVTDAWRDTTRARIQDSDHVIFLCSQDTANASGVNEEFRIVQEEQKPHLLLWARREQMCTMPKGAKAGSMYQWTRETLTEQLSPRLRNAQARRAAKRP
mgnify:CR=1 FL=1